MSYASGTKVAVTKTMAEIEELVRKRGGQRFYRGETDGKMVLGWWQHDRMVMFGVHLPSLESFKRRPGRGYGIRTLVEQEAAREQAMREHWRAVLLVIKAKFASVDSKIEQFEEAFLGQLVVPGEDGRHVPFAKLAIKSIAEVYTGGRMKALPVGGPTA